MSTPDHRHLAILRFFEDVPDPRVECTRLHSLMDVLVVALLTMICVGEGRENMEESGEAKEEWLKTFLDLPNGIPSADTFRRVVSAIAPAAFNACFIAWVEQLSEGTRGKLVAIDDKTIRHSFDHATGKKALHVVSAWMADNRLALGRLATEEKSNEITAIPKLFELLDLRGAQEPATPSDVRRAPITISRARLFRKHRTRERHRHRRRATSRCCTLTR